MFNNVNRKVLLAPILDNFNDCFLLSNSQYKQDLFDTTRDLSILSTSQLPTSIYIHIKLLSKAFGRGNITQRYEHRCGDSFQ